jgi:hypothetical protein
MCDKKYMSEIEGINNLENFIGNKFTLTETNATKDIITNMSYSKVMKTGNPIFPNLEDWQHAYHIVREADLLAAYDFDRCMIYQIEKLDGDFDTAFRDAKKLFENRMLKHFDNNLFLTTQGKEIGKKLHIDSLDRIKIWDALSEKEIL